MSQQSFTLVEATRKLEQYCAYQERCHQEVIEKLRSFRMIPEAVDLIMVHLIQHNFLNEERFACSFARGKHRIKHWGRVRIVNELKFRGISKTNITTALKEIQDEYLDSFEILAARQWAAISETRPLIKRKKFCDYLLRKGFESQLVYEKAVALEQPER